MRLYLSSFRIGNRPEELLRLTRGGRRVGLILNADDYKPPRERQESLDRELIELNQAGLQPLEIDLRHYFGRPDELREALGNVDAVYVRGGNVFILRRAFEKSGAAALIREWLAEDRVVYAGYSAGPCLLGPTLRGIEDYEDDPEVVPDGYDHEVIWDGLGVLPYAILPHYRPDRSEIARRVQLYIEHHIPFVALADGEVLVVDESGSRVVR